MNVNQNESVIKLSHTKTLGVNTKQTEGGNYHLGDIAYIVKRMSKLDDQSDIMSVQGFGGIENRMFELSRCKLDQKFVF